MAVLNLKTEHIVLLGLAALVAYGATFKQRLLDKLATFIPSVEGFRSHPYWDKSRYSWGYGTAAPGATGTITREQAFHDMIAYLMRDFATLSGRITRRLSVNQWAALLSFSYNLGVGNAFNLVPLINSGDSSGLEYKWGRYIYAGGEVDQGLIDRRAKEWALYNS